MQGDGASIQCGGVHARCKVVSGPGQKVAEKGGGVLYDKRREDIDGTGGSSKKLEMSAWPGICFSRLWGAAGEGFVFFLWG